LEITLIGNLLVGITESKLITIGNEKTAAAAKKSQLKSVIVALQLAESFFSKKAYN